MFFLLGTVIRFEYRSVLQHLTISHNTRDPLVSKHEQPSCKLLYIPGMASSIFLKGKVGTFPEDAILVFNKVF